MRIKRNGQEIPVQEVSRIMHRPITIERCIACLQEMQQYSDWFELDIGLSGTLYLAPVAVDKNGKPLDYHVILDDLFTPMHERRDRQ